MAQNQLNVTVSFEGELAQYLKDIAEIDNKSVEEMLVHLVTEALEEDIECSKIIEERKRNIDDEELVRAEDVDWDEVLSEEDKQKYKVAYSKDVLEKQLYRKRSDRGL